MTHGIALRPNSPAIRHGWPLVLIITALQGGGQALVAPFSPVLCTFAGGTAALVALYPLSRWKRYGEPAEGIADRPAMRGDETGDAEDRSPPMGLGMSFVPYVVLSVVALAVLTIQPVNRAFSALSIGLPFPAVTTGYGVANDAADPYSPFAPLTHPGTFLLVTAVVTGAPKSNTFGVSKLASQRWSTAASAAAGSRSSRLLLRPQG